MRIRQLVLSVAALLGVAALATAQQPAPVPAAPAALAAQPPAGMVAVPGQPLVAQPVVIAAQPGCGTPAPCATGCAAPAKKSSLFDRLCGGTANPISCGCLAAERTFAFGSCRSFYTPGRTCNGTAIEYGCGSGECGPKDNCKHIISFNNR
jgi:hypothetical protein